MKNNKVIIFIVGLLAGLLIMYLFNTYKIEKRTETTTWNSDSKENKATNIDVKSSKSSNKNSNDNNIDDLTAEKTVIEFVKQNKTLPDYYITKNEAKQQGWIASQGNLCDVLPGKAIGGDKFSNREKQLPKGEQYYEADVNYECGRRNADRIVFTKNGDVWLTHNHYKSFVKQ